MSITVAELEEHIACLEADLREERERRSAAQIAWAAEVESLTARLYALRDDRDCEKRLRKDAEDARELALERVAELGKPVDMVLHCPACLEQHIDAPEDADCDGEVVHSVGWSNPPHRSHLCHQCGHIWRPADVATNGVFRTKTHGKDDMVLIDGPAHELRLARLRADLEAPTPLDWGGPTEGEKP